MKKIILFIFIILNFNLDSLGGWEVIYPGLNIYGSYYKDIAFFNDQTGWLLTQSDVRKTTNGAQTWIKYDLSRGYYTSMTCAQFLNKDTAWVLVGKFLNFTTNSGANWTIMDSSTSNIKSMHFLDINNGWACGSSGSVYKTTNGGKNWLSINTGTSNNLNAVSFADNNFGVCGGDWGTIIWTTNGGLNWNNFTDSYINFFTNVKCFNNQTCIVTGTGSILYRTTNRGASWQPHFTNLLIQNTIELDPANNGYIFGSPNSFIRTANSGSTWETITSVSLFSQVYSASITPSNTFWCAADSGIIFRSSTNGNNWDIAYREYITQENLKSVYFVNQSTGLAAGTHGIMLRTTNGGINWNSQFLGTDKTFNSIQFVNSETGYAAGGESYSFGIVYKTTNSGISWQQVYRDSLQLVSVHFINPSTGWSAANSRAIIKTTDAGNNWSKSIITTTQPLNIIYDIFFINENTGFIGSTGMYKTTDGGINWYRVLVYISQTIQFIGNSGFAITNAAGNFMKSTNTGENWVSYPTGGSYRGDVFFINTETGWVNTPNIIRKTTNGGINWAVQNTDLNSISANALFFINENIGWAAGNYGGIMRTTNGGIGISTISTEIPRQFNLYQNYPNPFNPVTKIRFSIPSTLENRQSVSLKIYDILGKEIAVLVNENLLPGTYETEWNASNYSSGIYFYSLLTDNFTQTRKMVLIK